MKRAFSPQPLRDAMLSCLPAETSTYDAPPETQFFYVPRRHERALSPDTALVVGIRGAGKSVWHNALQRPEYRKALAAALPRVHIDEATKVTAGFGVTSNPDLYPGEDTLESLLRMKHDARGIWRTVIAIQTWAAEGSELSALPTWNERVRWVAEHPEQVERAFAAYNRDLDAAGRLHLITFDALDRTSAERTTVSTLLKGLLRVLLDFRAFRALRAKAFVRPDLVEDPNVTEFADASKLTAAMVELRWGLLDLYSLLFKYLANCSNCPFADDVQEIFGTRWPKTGDIRDVPEALQHEEIQKEIVHAMTGPFMGANPRRGFPYTWLPRHLADGKEQVSPRSFVSAVRAAAEDSAQSRADHQYALHYESIKAGVQRASRIRVDELREDFKWMAAAMDPLKGLVIPIDFKEIERRWKANHTLQKVDATPGLKPRGLSEGASGVRRELETIGIFTRMVDGRVNMPDVYRVAFGLGRKGGVVPLRAT